ncbi:MAG: hypothetical protein HC819_13120 [Cyclobacteriaceae bacterium]|nr:hypothetical protein [Cyclobacteriaceae bacterium]
MKTKIIILIPLLMFCTYAFAQQIPKAGSPEMPLEYIGQPKYMKDHRHDGYLRPVVGVQNIQILRANRSNPPETNKAGNTYNHAPMMAYWNGKFYVQYLAHEWEEHGNPTETYLLHSEDGYNWSSPRLLFPAIEYEPGRFTIAHQRMGFYVAPNGKLLTLSFYGAPGVGKDSPNSGEGIGRAVREIKEDGTWGPIYFLRYNRHYGFNEKNTGQWYLSYTQSPDKAFVQACNDLLKNKLMTQQWWEEDRSTDGFYTIDDTSEEDFSAKALSFYHRKDGKVVGLWKSAYAAISDDEGKTWSTPVAVKSKPEDTGKEWGQKTDDGRYAITYNPAGADMRMPLAIISSDDGITFDNMLAVHGEAPEQRFAGRFMNIGAQYNRGIAEGNGNPPGDDMWIVYAQSKQDLWVSRIPIAPVSAVQEDVDENFESMDLHTIPDGWNVYKPTWSQIQIEEESGNKYLHIRDEEPYDYAKVVKVFPEANAVTIEFSLLDYEGQHLEIDVTDSEGKRAVHMTDFPWNYLLANDGRSIKYLKRLPAKEDYRVVVHIDLKKQSYSLVLNGETLLENAGLYESVGTVEGLEFRTGMFRMDNLYANDLLAPKDTGLPGADQKAHRIANYKIDDVKITTK